MNTDQPQPQSPAPASPPITHISLFRNWISLTGLVVVAAALFAALLLFTLELFAKTSNPYVGILTYLVAPAFMVVGAIGTIAGALLERRQIKKMHGEAPKMVINLSRPRDQRTLVIFVAGTVLFLLLTAMASYQSYHFTDSTTFCGKACHTVMKPEMVAYENGAHARVACTECHIGPGAAWFVRAKLSGIYQVYATLTRKYPTPVPTPIENLRPAQETCEQCHWPSAFVGNLDRTYTSFLSDSSNTSYSVRMLLRVGGASPSRGPVGGIHWHMNIANKIEYHATDQKRQQIPWVRVTNPQGVVTEFRAPGFTNDAAELSIRQMDCMDCHNRPAHSINSPNTAVNLAMRLGQLDPNQPNVIDSSLPFIKTNAVFALTRPYTNEIQARNEIATFLASQYPNATRDTKVSRTIEAVQYLYSQNFFPEMKASWRAYPNNIGHKDWPGCFRCHDGKHKSPDGKQIITANDCNACHTILAQGRGEAMAHLDAKGLDFKHPGDEIDKESLCSDCHNGE